MAFKNWNDIAKNDLVLPFGDKSYTIPPLGYIDELRINENQKAFAELRAARDKAIEAGEDPPAMQVPDPIPDETFLKMMLGGALQQMRADNQPSAAILHAASVAHTAAIAGRAAAEVLWETGLDPEAMAAMRAALWDSPSSTDSTRSRSTASGTRTRKPASTTSTTSRTASSRAARAKAAKSGGTTSSPKST